ncbi:tetratricopeptide repeat protein [Gallaecimonas xiamenensis]|uniref:Transcriptional regulator n=1 Tax=Gallaecimonas xiamenensis 3-C-1 TaxID=745411 RepID=K2J6E3_9GAMM|nr:tetratricopeptide repeat protein [Gallaecimonas xiamenensis]EKE70608.1 transcriptional regulator [Gallaecimonas xiamenensis 3-C-1]
MMLSAELRSRLSASSAKPVLTALHLAAELAQTDVRAFEGPLLGWRDQLGLRLGGLQGQERLQGLLDFFYQDLAFSSENSHYSSQGCLLTSVILERRGGAAALGLLLLYFAEDQAIPLDGINFPGQLVLTSPLKAGAFFDPLAGLWHPLSDLELWLRGAKGNWQRLKDKHTEPLDNQGLLLKLLGATKGALTRDGRLMEAVKVTQAMVELSPDNPYLIRDRGYLLAELDCVAPARKDLTYFVEHCPDDPACPLLRQKVDGLGAADATLH